METLRGLPRRAGRSLLPVAGGGVIVIDAAGHLHVLEVAADGPRVTPPG